MEFSLEQSLIEINEFGESNKSIQNDLETINNPVIWALVAVC